MAPKLKRIQLFEFEDQPWFPAWLRNCMTGLINVMHCLLKTADNVSERLAKVIEQTGEQRIVDFCSGSGGPMPEVAKRLSTRFPEISVLLTDLYPNKTLAKGQKNNQVHYEREPVDVLDPKVREGIRTMICSFHHFRPEQASRILQSAIQARQPIFIYEISDNSFPLWLWWTAIPVNIISCLFITPMVRPLSWYQLLFTYVIPVLPLCFAWDGAVSNARTYTPSDLQQLLNALPENDYQWNIEPIPGKPGKLCFLGQPGI